MILTGCAAKSGKPQTEIITEPAQCYNVPAIYLQRCRWPELPPEKGGASDGLEWDAYAKPIFKRCHDLHNKFVTEYKNENQRSN